MIKEKNCVKGFACSNTCISRTKECRNELSQSAAEVADKFTAMLLNQYNELEQLTPEEKNLRKKNQAKFDSVGQAQAYLKYHEAMEELETSTDYQATFKNLQEKPWEANPIYKLYNNGELANEAAYKAKREYSKQVVDEIYKKAPRSLLGAIETKGQPCARKADDRNPICDSKGEERRLAFEKRGRAILENMVMFDLKDPVTNEVTNWREIQPDHIVPLSKVGAEADNPTNLNIVHRAYNQTKNSRDYQTVLKSLQNLATEEGFKANQENSKAKQNKAASKLAAHKDNYDIVKEDKQLAERYLSENIKSAEDINLMLKVISERASGKEKRPFAGNGGRGEKAGVDSGNYLIKRHFGLPVNDKETEAFEKALAKTLSNSPGRSRENVLATFGITD